MILLAIATLPIGLLAVLRPQWALRLVLICLLLAAVVVTSNWLRSVLSLTVPERRAIRRVRRSRSRSAEHHPPRAAAELSEPRGPAGLSQTGLRQIRFVGSERLWTAHRLNIANPQDWPAIQQRVSPQLWNVLNSNSGASASKAKQLSRLLNEIEEI